MRDQHFNKAGQQIQQHTWARYFEDKDYRRIGYTDVDGTVVSTLWVGHSMGEATDDPPLIFETVVFGMPTDEDTWTKFTPSEHKAKAMHRAAVRWVSGKGPQPGLTEYELHEAEERFRNAVAAVEEARTIRNQIVKDAITSKWTHKRIADATGLTRARVGQIALAKEVDER